MKYRLKNPFIQIRYQNRVFYGGDQAWCRQKYMRQSGCGVIASANLILCSNAKSREDTRISHEAYMELVEELQRRYFLVLPMLGLNGIFLSIGVKRYFFHQGNRKKVHWGCLPSHIWEETARMLEQGLPVILAVGPNMPWFFKKHRLKLYVKKGQNYQVEQSVYAHYVTVTEMDERWLTVSSWGKKYFINKKEYMEYTKRHSNCLYSNILVVRNVVSDMGR